MAIGETNTFVGRRQPRSVGRRVGTAADHDGGRQRSRHREQRRCPRRTPSAPRPTCWPPRSWSPLPCPAASTPRRRRSRSSCRRAPSRSSPARWRPIQASSGAGEPTTSRCRAARQPGWLGRPRVGPLRRHRHPGPRPRSSAAVLLRAGADPGPMSIAERVEAYSVQVSPDTRCPVEAGIRAGPGAGQGGSRRTPRPQPRPQRPTGAAPDRRGQRLQAVRVALVHVARRCLGSGILGLLVGSAVAAHRRPRVHRDRLLHPADVPPRFEQDATAPGPSTTRCPRCCS